MCYRSNTFVTRRLRLPLTVFIISTDVRGNFFTGARKSTGDRARNASCHTSHYEYKRGSLFFTPSLSINRFSLSRPLPQVSLSLSLFRHSEHRSQIPKFPPSRPSRDNAIRKIDTARLRGRFTSDNLIRRLRLLHPRGLNRFAKNLSSPKQPGYTDTSTTRDPF